MKKILALLLMSSAPSWAQTSVPQTSVLTVSGRGEARTENTVAVIQLGFEAAGPGEAEVRADVTKRSAAVTAALKEDAKIERLQTTAVNIRPQVDYGSAASNSKPQAPKITGYIGQLTVSFAAPVEEAGRIITSSLSQGANAVNHIFTEPTATARRAAEESALQLAAKDAEAQAKSLLTTLGLEWAGILAINAGGDVPSPAPMPRMMMAEAAVSSAPALGIEGGETVINREVTLQVKFRDR